MGTGTSAGSPSWVVGAQACGPSFCCLCQALGRAPATCLVGLSRCSTLRWFLMQAGESYRGTSRTGQLHCFILGIPCSTDSRNLLYPREEEECFYRKGECFPDTPPPLGSQMRASAAVEEPLRLTRRQTGIHMVGEVWLWTRNPKSAIYPSHFNLSSDTSTCQCAWLPDSSHLPYLLPAD